MDASVVPLPCVLKGYLALDKLASYSHNLGFCAWVLKPMRFKWLKIWAGNDQMD